MQRFRLFVIRNCDGQGKRDLAICYDVSFGDVSNHRTFSSKDDGNNEDGEKPVGHKDEKHTI